MSSAPILVRRFRARELAKFVPTAALNVSRLPDNPTPIRVQNPFIPWFNPETKRWAPPLYSRRRQAELLKAAKKSGSLHLLPPGPKLGVTELQKYTQLARETKLHAEQLSAGTASAYPTNQSNHDRAAELTDLDAEVEWTGTVKERAVPGADIGARLYAGKKRMFKGHKWERQLSKRRGEIAVRMRDMAKRIQRFKAIYKRRKPNPLRPPKANKKAKLPF